MIIRHVHADRSIFGNLIGLWVAFYCMPFWLCSHHCLPWCFDGSLGGVDRSNYNICFVVCFCDYRPPPQSQSRCFDTKQVMWNVARANTRSIQNWSITSIAHYLADDLAGLMKAMVGNNSSCSHRHWLTIANSWSNNFGVEVRPARYWSGNYDWDRWFLKSWHNVGFWIALKEKKFLHLVSSLLGANSSVANENSNF